MITDAFITSLEATFQAFGVDERVSRTDQSSVCAGEVVIVRGAMHFILYAGGDEVANIDLSMPKTAIIAAVEWHQNNPRQGFLALVEKVAS